MEFRIADTFTDSLGRLTGEEQRAAKTTAFDLQLDPASPGMRFHRLDRARDPNFWSVRVNDDLRLIVHRAPGSLLLCYVDHHDRAYAWAGRRKLETHPTTGAAQLVEIRETVQEIVVPSYVPGPAPARRPLFMHVAEEALLGYGVPAEWLGDVRQATEETLLELADHLPGEAAEALLEMATGGTPRARPAIPAVGAFEHPDAQRRFRVVSDLEELARALEYPWEKWTIFLHPAQRELVERRFSGPARIAGTAGTGKTIVALHRAVHLARANPESRVLLTTFTEALANALRVKLRRLIGTEPRLAERLEVETLETAARRLGKRLPGGAAIAPPEVVREIVREAARGDGPSTSLSDGPSKLGTPPTRGGREEIPGPGLSPRFLVSEWGEVVDAWQLASWEAYRDVPRLGRKTRLPEKRREALWAVFARVRSRLAERGLMTQADLYSRLVEQLAGGRSPFDFVVVDEAQDLGVAELRFAAALGGSRPDGLFFAGDLGQRIFQLPFSWKALGVDVRGRSGTLRVNYRTSHQIRAQADRLLGPQLSDVDGAVEERGGAVSVFNGPPPMVHLLATPEEESAAVGRWLAERATEGVKPEEMAVFVRSGTELPRALAAVEASGLRAARLDEKVETPRGHVAVGTMHLGKGLEFRAVAVMACDDEVLPLQERIEAVTDDADLEEVYNTERHLLYVACTRARDHLLVTGVEPASEFLRDFTG